jgi:polyphosphate kinase
MTAACTSTASSQLQFNIRVLEQALDESYPLLERLKFLLIFSSNLDEFFEIRVAGLKKQITFAREQAGADGLQPHQALARISELVHGHVDRQYAILNDVLLPERKHRSASSVAVTGRPSSRPGCAATSATRSPRSSPRSASTRRTRSRAGEQEPELHRRAGASTPSVAIPAWRSSGTAPAARIIKVPESRRAGDNYVFLSSMIHAHADDLFQGMKVKGCYQFRLTRNADLALDSEDVEDLARALRGELFSRRYGDAVRLEVADTCPKHLSDYLLKQFNLSETELYQVNGPVNLTRLFSITGLDSHPELQYTPFTPQIPKLLQNSENIFSVISKQDILLLHPFESFTPVVDLLRRRQGPARSGRAPDPVPLAPTRKSSMLVDAARNGKEVTAVIELRALRRRVQPALASRLQAPPAVVIYGVVGFKTHAKMMLIRREAEIVRYAPGYR